MDERDKQLVYVEMETLRRLLGVTDDLHKIAEKRGKQYDIIISFIDEGEQIDDEERKLLVEKMLEVSDEDLITMARYDKYITDTAKRFGLERKNNS